MKEIAVLSGKGGTGKTSVVGCLASLAGKKVLCDCDVDAADLHLLLSPTVVEEREFRSGQTALIECHNCTQCGLCGDLCRFNAIQGHTVDPSFCEGCGFCSRVCPENAVVMKDNLAGHWYISETRYGPMVHASLGIAEENSGKLVTTVRNQAQQIAIDHGIGLVITDGPPGIGCPVISSLSGADLALIVTEPTLSGIHDLQRVIDVCKHFMVPEVVCINKYDINEENTRQIEQICSNSGIKVVARIPFDKAFVEALIQGVPVTEYSDGAIADLIESMAKSILEAVPE